MNIRIAAAAVCTAIGMAAAGVAIAQASWPQITRADLEACRTVITAAHKKERDFFFKDVARYCTAGTDYTSPENCTSAKGWIATNEKEDAVD